MYKPKQVIKKFSTVFSEYLPQDFLETYTSCFYRCLITPTIITKESSWENEQAHVCVEQEFLYKEIL